MVGAGTTGTIALAGGAGSSVWGRAWSMILVTTPGCPASLPFCCPQAPRRIIGIRTTGRGSDVTRMDEITRIACALFPRQSAGTVAGKQARYLPSIPAD